MSNNIILAPIVSEMLMELQAIFSKFDIDFYLVGAVARDIHLSANEQLKSARGTKDIDLAITINDEGQYNQVKAALIDTSLFVAHETEIIKLIYKNSIVVDLLPLTTERLLPIEFDFLTFTCTITKRFFEIKV